MGDYSKTEQVIGLDLGDEWSHYHVLKGGEEVGVKGRVKTRRSCCLSRSTPTLLSDWHSCRHENDRDEI
jgi:hypothetical protein